MRTVLAGKFRYLGRCGIAWVVVAISLLETLFSGGGIAQTAADDRGAERDRAVMRLAKGNEDVMRGNTGAALQNYAVARRVFESLLAEDPRNSDWQRDLSVVQEKIGDVFLAQGN